MPRATVTGICGKLWTSDHPGESELHFNQRNLIQKWGSAIILLSLDAEAFQSGVLYLSEENIAEIREQADAFLEAV